MRPRIIDVILAVGIIIAIALAVLLPDNDQKAPPASHLLTSSLPPHPADGGRKPMAPMKPPVKSSHKTGAVASEWVVEYDTRDSHVNISPIVNAAASYYGLPPTFVLAVIFAESAGNQYAYRHATNYDWSCGLMQVVVSNVSYYTGISDPNAACRWEYNPQNIIWLGARMLREYENAYGVSPPALWGCYNAGASCQSPYYAGFYANYLNALNYAGGSPPAPPTPPTPKPHKVTFGKERARVWGEYRKERHLSFIPHQGWFARRWHNANWRYAGGIVQHEQYNAKKHLMFEVTQRYWAFWWPKHPRWHIEWHEHKWIR